MYSRILIVFGLLFSATLSSAGHAQPMAAPTDSPAAGSGGTCPYRGWSGDGCAGAVGSFLVAPHYGAASFYAFAAQSGQQWAKGPHPWNWNSPGVDYPVGPPAGLVLADPATARLPVGCAYLPHGSPANGPVVYCDRGAVNPVLTGLDFSLHGCVMFLAKKNVRGEIIIKNSYFKNGPNCSVINGHLISVETGNSPFTLKNDLIDEDYPNYTTPLTSTVGINTSTAPLTVLNTAVINPSQRPLSGSSDGPLDVENSVFIGISMATTANTGAHGEIFELQSKSFTSRYKSVTYKNNIIVIPSSENNAITSPFYGVGETSLQYVDEYTVEHNVVVINKAGGANAGIANNISGVVSGNILSVDNGYTGNITVQAVIVGIPPLAGAKSATILSKLDSNQFVLSGNVGQGRFTGAYTLSATTSAALVELIHATGYGAVRIDNNFVDPSGALSCIQVGSRISGLLATANISLVTATPISGLGYQYNGAACGPLF